MLESGDDVDVDVDIRMRGYYGYGILFDIWRQSFVLPMMSLFVGIWLFSSFFKKGI